MDHLVLLPETSVLGQERGPITDLGSVPSRILDLTLYINRILERETLAVRVWGSPDGETWGSKPLLVIPHKYYCGEYHHALDLEQHPHVRYLMVECSVDAWGHPQRRPMAGITVTATPVHETVLTAAV